METSRCFHEEIVQHVVKETDLGKELDKVVEELRATLGGKFVRVSVSILLNSGQFRALIWTCSIIGHHHSKLYGDHACAILLLHPSPYAWGGPVRHN